MVAATAEALEAPVKASKEANGVTQTGCGSLLQHKRRGGGGTPAGTDAVLGGSAVGEASRRRPGDTGEATKCHQIDADQGERDSVVEEAGESGGGPILRSRSRQHFADTTATFTAALPLHELRTLSASGEYNKARWWGDGVQNVGRR